MKRAIKISLRVLANSDGVIVAGSDWRYFLCKTTSTAVYFPFGIRNRKGPEWSYAAYWRYQYWLRGDHFPLIALTIDSIYLRDSLWSRHHHNLVSANQVYATIDFWQLFHGKIDIKRLVLDIQDIYFYTDSTRYSNTSVLKREKESAAK